MDRLPGTAPPLRRPDPGRARHRLERFYWACADTDLPELHRLGRTIAAWENQLLAYFTTGGVSNERASHCTFYRGSDAAGLVGLLVA